MSPSEIDQVWNMLAQTFGKQFLENYGPRPNEAWTAALEAMQFHQATHAWREIVKGGSAFPPTLPEFAAAARRWRPPPAEPNRAIPWTVNREKSAENLRKLRELLNS